MRSRWSDAEARKLVDRYGAAHGEDLAVRVYSSRLIGSHRDLVLHGGGNTSVKRRTRDLLGEDLDVVHVKGTGQDLAMIEPRGLPALELQPLLRLRQVERLNDLDLVNQLRIRLLDADAPTPSIETLLHAFLPHRFVDHTHADAFLVLGNQPDGEDLLREALGDRVVILPWIMPGFPLAKAVASAFEQNEGCEAIALLGHGIFTFGDDARGTYEQMVSVVDRVETFIAGRIGRKNTMTSAVDGIDRAAIQRRAGDAMPVLRGALALHTDGRYGGVFRRAVGEWRGADELVAFSRHPQCKALLDQGPLTPDHLIRTKGRYLFLEPEQALDPAACREAVQEYVLDYVAYFERHKGRMAEPPLMVAPIPRVVVVRGAGVFAFGGDKDAAVVAADIAEHTLAAKSVGQALGRFQSLPEADLFDMEYWSLQQAKLGGKAEPLLAGQIALVTGAAGAIGWGICDALLGAGAHVFATDSDALRLERLREKLLSVHDDARVRSAAMDVTDPDHVAAAFRECCLAFGGLDILVPNAGIAHVSKIADMDAHKFARVVEVNLQGTLNVLTQAARIFEHQQTGGSVVIQASKNVFDPGAGFGAYSASKAGVHQLGRIAALELAELGVRVNMINADAVFGDEDMPSGLWEQVGPDRMKARNLDPQGLRDFYRQRSLLKVSVLPAHVGEAVVFFAAGRTPTTGATLPVDGGIPGAFPR